GDDVGVVEGGHDGEPVPRGDLLGLGAAVLRGASGHHHFAAPVLHALDLHGGSGFGHDDHGAHAELLGGVGHGLTVIPRGEGDHPALADSGWQTAYGIVGAADLEGAHRLLVFELQVRA